MKVSIIGPGAMGCLFAARLCDAGVSTTLIDYKADRAERLAESGIKVECEPEAIKAKPAVATTIPPKQDLIIVLTKAYTTGALKLPSGVPVLTLQNGLGNVETLCEMVGSPLVLAGTTSEASTHLGEGHIRHAASGLTRIGSWTTCPTDAAQDALSSAGFEVEITDTPGQILWEKVIVSAGINTLTALLDLPNGRLLEGVDSRMLMRDLVVEAAKVASTEGYRFEHSLIEAAEDICRDTANNISSMLQDIRAHRRTEIETISGEIIRRASLASLPVPRTIVIYQLIRTIEQR